MEAYTDENKDANAQDAPDLVTTGEAARRIGICRQSVLRWLDRGWLVPYDKLPNGQIRLLARDVDAAIARYKEAANAK